MRAPRVGTPDVVATDRFRGVGTRRGSKGRGRRRGASTAPQAPSGPRCRGKIKKMVRDRGFGFIRGSLASGASTTSSVSAVPPAALSFTV